jgi:DNA-binding beta-propeller fold protein YncE
LRKFGRLGDQAGDFSRPKGIGVDSEGHVYVADAAFDNFQVFDENGQLLLFIGGAGVEPGYFEVPAGVFVDENDRVYVVDSLSSRVQVFQYLSEKWKRANPGEYEKYVFNPAK